MSDDTTPRKITLTQGKFALVDAADYGWLKQFNWYADKANVGWYATRNVRTNGEWGHIRMHREIMGAPPWLEVDHRNLNGLDNRRSNLRLCTHAQQMRNKRSLRGSSRYKGVYWKKDCGRWRAQIGVHGKSIHLGYFQNEIDAALAYNEAALDRFGEFALLNEIPAG
jgi:hypothetical protein